MKAKWIWLTWSLLGLSANPAFAVCETQWASPFSESILKPPVNTSGEAEQIFQKMLAGMGCEGLKTVGASTLVDKSATQSPSEWRVSMTSTNCCLPDYSKIVGDTYGCPTGFHYVAFDQKKNQAYWWGDGGVCSGAGAKTASVSKGKLASRSLSSEPSKGLHGPRAVEEEIQRIEKR